ncbi:MAG: chromosomal replication initiator protein DnaA [Puniceicoccales bacterium]|jgi:chromosomal replication initiator protein|nr:chromosomal replication initiator protein DnaA [Puniceicoccales bacterium]
MSAGEQQSLIPLWSVIQADFRNIFPEDVYRAWFMSLTCDLVDEDVIVLGVPNDFAAIWIKENYADVITKRFQLALGHNVEVQFQARPSEDSAVTPAVADPPHKEGHQAMAMSLGTEVLEDEELSTEAGKEHCVINTEGDSYLLNPKNTFKNFIVGAGNEMAHAACIAIANAPAKAYNPLFLYGDTGLGKTHLMHAVAHYVLCRTPQTRIVYTSTEKFTNEFIQAIQTNALTRFRQKYRRVDILLIDDIHFLSGKERIQEEFFHTFNELFESQKQIFLCSDRPASEISKLENRLVSRFQWGLVTDIQVPDLETRMAILGRKSSDINLHLGPEVLEFLAQRVSTNVRCLEGALTRIASYASLTKVTVDVSTVSRLLRDIFQEEKQIQIPLELIQKKVAEYYNIKLSDMLGKKRPASIAFPRQVAMYLSRLVTSQSLVEIGQMFGGRDHGTVIHACKAVENMMEQDPAIKQSIESLKQSLQKGF